MSWPASRSVSSTCAICGIGVAKRWKPYCERINCKWWYAEGDQCLNPRLRNEFGRFPSAMAVRVSQGGKCKWGEELGEGEKYPWLSPPSYRRANEPGAS